MIPSDPGYTPAALNPAVLSSKLYRSLLARDIDPYASHSRDDSLISLCEQCARQTETATI